MKFRVIVAGLLVAAGAASAKAQCAGAVPLAAQDGCQKAIDLLNFMTPQLSTALVGGNPTLGQGGTLGGLGHFSLDIRASAVNGQLPQFKNVGLNVTGAQASTFPSKQQYIPFPSFDAGVGLWRGWSLGVTHVGGVDALVTMTYVPNMSNGGNSSQTNFTVNGSNEKFGYGLRLGLLEESAVTPGVSVAWVQRNLPSLTVNGSVDASGSNPAGTLALNDFTVKTTAWRVTAAKSFLIFGLSAGVGQDKYDANSTISATVAVAGNPSGTVPSSLAMTRTNYHVGAYMNLFVFKLEAEYGQVTGGSVPAPMNNYGSDPASSRSYITLGLRFGR